MGVRIQRAVAFLAALVVAALLLTPGRADAQLIQGGAVGGVMIDADGVLTNPERGAQAEMVAAWQAGLEPAPADLQRYTDRRYVSLRGLEQQLAEANATGEPLPDSVRYVAGLLRVEYVLIYPDKGPDKGDVVLAGPAEGWKVDALGNAVGATTGRPVLMLDDLMVALRTAEASNGSGISCSIDPTPEGLARIQRVRLTRGERPDLAARKLEQALGPQVITVSGVPATSHFARTLVAADFRMKRLAMNFEPAPIGSLPSYLELLPQRSSAAQDLLPRWWLAPHYDAVQTDGEGLAWRLVGQGVKCLTEESVANAEGRLTRTGKANRFAQQWADLMTEQFEDLANHDSSFGQLRNAIDLAVAAAIISQERALERVGLEAPHLTEQAEVEQYPAPRTVASQVSFVRKRGKTVLSASGGVQLYPWEVASEAEPDASLQQVRSQATTSTADQWWWQ